MSKQAWRIKFEEWLVANGDAWMIEFVLHIALLSRVIRLLRFGDFVKDFEKWLSFDEEFAKHLPDELEKEPIVDGAVLTWRPGFEKWLTNADCSDQMAGFVDHLALFKRCARLLQSKNAQDRLNSWLLPIEDLSGRINTIRSRGLIVTIPECDGSYTIAKATAVFKSQRSDISTQYWDASGESRGETSVLIQESSAEFRQQFCSWNALNAMNRDRDSGMSMSRIDSELVRKSLTQHQIVSFCMNHSDLLTRNTNFFLFKEKDKWEKDQFCVATVDVIAGDLHVRICSFGSCFSHPFTATRRIFVRHIG